MAQSPLLGEIRFLVAPGIPELAERAYFQDLVSTYGKLFTPGNMTRTTFPMVSN